LREGAAEAIKVAPFIFTKKTMECFLCRQEQSKSGDHGWQWPRPAWPELKLYANIHGSTGDLQAQWIVFLLAEIFAGALTLITKIR
jgi:hypothetical protein